MVDYEQDGRISIKDSVARWLAALALVLAVVALIWAIRADNRAGDALDASRIILPEESSTP